MSGTVIGKKLARSVVIAYELLYFCFHIILRMPFLLVCDFQPGQSLIFFVLEQAFQLHNNFIALPSKIRFFWQCMELGVLKIDES